MGPSCASVYSHVRSFQPPNRYDPNLYNLVSKYRLLAKLQVPLTLSPLAHKFDSSLPTFPINLLVKTLCAIRDNSENNFCRTYAIFRI